MDTTATSNQKCLTCLAKKIGRRLKNWPMKCSRGFEWETSRKLRLLVTAFMVIFQDVQARRSTADSIARAIAAPKLKLR